MSCLPCSKVSKQEQNVVKYYQKVYNDTGVLYWVYRLESKGSFLFVSHSDWKKNRILENLVQPNFSNGAEYFRIDEFKSL